MKTIPLSDIQKQAATLQIAESFFESITLFALFQSNIFKQLALSPKSLAELHDSVGGNLASMEAMLDAAVALRILTKTDDLYSATDNLLDCVGRENSPAYLGEWIEFLHALAGPLLELGDNVRTGALPGALFEDMAGDNTPAKRMTRAMDAYARTRGIEIADKLDFSNTRLLLDLGCGPGTYSLAIMERYPNIRAILLDLPGPIAEARRIVAKRGMSDRVEFVESDAMSFTDPGKFDTLLISNTLHMLGSKGSRRMLKHCRYLLSPNGRIIVQAQFLNDDRISPRWPTLLNLIQRVATPNGRNHAIGETTDWMTEAGFVDIEYVRFSLWNVCSCLIGTRPADIQTD